MKRCCVAGGYLMFALLGMAQAQAQVETVVVTSHFVGPRAQKALTATWHRLTPESQAFVKSEGQRIYARTVTLTTARTEAKDNCPKAFESCGDKDASLLAALALGEALSDSIPDGRHLLSSIPREEMRNTLDQLQTCSRRDDKKCMRKVIMKSLPADERQAFERIDEHLGEIRRDLKQTLAQAGFDQKGDK